MCEIIARVYRTGSVNVSVNGLSRMARSSMEIVYDTRPLFRGGGGGGGGGGGVAWEQDYSTTFTDWSFLDPERESCDPFPTSRPTTSWGSTRRQSKTVTLQLG